MPSLQEVIASLSNILPTGFAGHFVGNSLEKVDGWAPVVYSGKDYLLLGYLQQKNGMRSAL